MIEYIRNILPRIQQYSKSLDHKENYVDKPWIFIDDNNSTHEYEFCRDGRLIMSLNGQVQFGKWEYRPATQRLLIERPTDAILMQSAFIDDGLMILKKSASDDPTFILVNSAVIPDLDVVGYLQRFLSSKTQAMPQNKPEEDNYLTGSPTADVWFIRLLLAIFVLLFVVLIVKSIYKGSFN